MEQTLAGYGLTSKRSIIPGDVTEAISPDGSTIIVWSGKTDLGSDQHERDSRVRLCSDYYEEHSRNVAGLYVEHPEDGGHLTHGNKCASITTDRMKQRGTGTSLRLLPVVTTEELKHDHHTALAGAERVAGRIGTAIVHDGISVADQYNKAFCELHSISGKLFKLHDDALHKIITETNDTKGKHAKTGQCDHSLVQQHELALEVIREQACDLREYITKVENMTARLSDLHLELSNVLK